MISRTRLSWVCGVAGTLAVLAWSPPAGAIVIGVTSAGPGGLNANDSIDWGQLGPAFTVLSSPQNVASNGLLDATVSSAGGIFERVDQGNGWAGNFPGGDHLLWDQGAGPNI